MRLILLLFVILSLLSCSGDHPKPQTPSSDTQGAAAKEMSLSVLRIPDFDGQSAYTYLTKQTDFGSRDPGSPGHEQCLLFLQNELQKFSDLVVLQPFSHSGYENHHFRMTNVFASFNPKTTTRILLMAHWDSRPRADQDPDPTKLKLPILGANDGASGVAILLEIARLLKEHPSRAGVDMLLTDGEDYGEENDRARYLLGARYFTKNLPQGFNPTFGILLDMVGDSQLELMKESNSLRYAPDVVDLVWSTAKELGVYQFTDRVQGFVMDDHLPLNEIGIKTIDLIDFNYPDESNSFWHTSKDTPDKCSPESLEAVGKVLMYVIYSQPN